METMKNVMAVLFVLVATTNSVLSQDIDSVGRNETPYSFGLEASYIRLLPHNNNNELIGTVNIFNIKTPIYPFKSDFINIYANFGAAQFNPKGGSGTFDFLPSLILESTFSIHEDENSKLSAQSKAKVGYLYSKEPGVNAYFGMEAKEKSFAYNFGVQAVYTRIAEDGEETFSFGKSDDFSYFFLAKGGFSYKSDKVYFAEAGLGVRGGFNREQKLAYELQAGIAMKYFTVFLQNTNDVPLPGFPQTFIIGTVVNINSIFK